MDASWPRPDGASQKRALTGLSCHVGPWFVMDHFLPFWASIELVEGFNSIFESWPESCYNIPMICWRNANQTHYNSSLLTSSAVQIIMINKNKISSTHNTCLHIRRSQQSWILTLQHHRQALLGTKREAAMRHLSEIPYQSSQAKKTTKITF